MSYKDPDIFGDAPKPEFKDPDIFGDTPSTEASTTSAKTVDPRQQVIDEMGPVQRGIVGVGAGMYDLAKGVQQLGATAGEKLGLVKPETVKRITEEGQSARDDFAPLREQSTAAKIGEFVGKTAPMVTLPGGVAGGALKRAGTSALAGGTIGAMDFVPEGGSRVINTAAGAGMGGGTSAVLSGAGKLINPFLKDATKTLPMQQLSDRFKIPLTLSEMQGAGGRTDVIMERVPSFLGIGGFRKQQQQAAKDAATTQFSKYVIDPSLDSTAAMKVANDAHLDTLYAKVRQNAAALPKGSAPEVKQTATDLIDRYPDVFESIQDTKVKRILADIRNDTATKQVPTGVLDSQGQPITKTVVPQFSFDDLWELRKGIGQAIGGAKTPTERAQFSAVYSAVSNDMDRMLAGSGGAMSEFKAANEAFKQYSLKFDAMREAYDKAIGTTGAGLQGFFSPQKYGTALKNLANDPKYKKNISWSSGEIQEMTGLANILQVTKRAGQFMENPPTGNRWGAITSGAGIGGGAFALGGATAAAEVAGAGATIALVTKFLTTTPAGKRLAVASSKIEPTSPVMARVMSQIYNQLPKMAASATTTAKPRLSENLGMSPMESAVLDPLGIR